MRDKIVYLDEKGVCPECGEEWDADETHGECPECSDERLPTDYHCNNCGHGWSEVDYTDGYGESQCPMCKSFDLTEQAP